MKKFFAVMLILVFFNTSRAEDICSTVKSKKTSNRSIAIDFRNNIFNLTTSHPIQDFSISRSGKWLAAYGPKYTPKSRSEPNSVVTFVHLSNNGKIRTAIDVEKGIYEIFFDTAEKKAYVSGTYGLTEIDLSNFHTKVRGISSQEKDYSQLTGACPDIHLQY
jgi:hypothetical protein